MTLRGSLGSLWRWFQSYFRRVVGYRVITNANNTAVVPSARRALLIYLTRPFSLKPQHPAFFTHQNLTQCKSIVSALGRSGFIVDVVDIDDQRFYPKRTYDLVISHRVNLIGWEHQLPEECVRVYLASGMNHVVHNRNIQRRYLHLRERRRVKPRIRSLNPEKMPYVELADMIFGFGNELTTGTWAESFQVPIYNFNNHGFPNTTFTDRRIDSNRNFLFFASSNQVGKGLDLLLEVFPKHPDLHLYVCSSFMTEPEFCSVYHKELFNTPNIHPIGIVRVNSAEYNYLTSKCAFVILPSCAEGQPGSVVQCMWSGLIPIVTKETGIDTASFGFTFADDELKSIEARILEVANMAHSQVETHSYETRSTAEKLYSSERFIDRWNGLANELRSMITR